MWLQESHWASVTSSGKRKMEQLVGNFQLFTIQPCFVKKKRECRGKNVFQARCQALGIGRKETDY